MKKKSIQSRQSRQLAYYYRHHGERLKAHREYYQKHRKSEISRVSKWHKDHPQQSRDAISKYAFSNRKKLAVRLQAWRKVPIADKCESCGSIENLERHHADYSKPLEVKTLCSKCHGQARYVGWEGT